MRPFAKFTLLVIVLVMSSFAGRYTEKSAVAAALNCPEIQECIDNGYVMDSCVELPISYKVQPNGEYEWGQINIRMSQFCQPPIYITCYIQGCYKRGTLSYVESHNTVTQ